MRDQGWRVTAEAEFEGFWHRNHASLVRALTFTLGDPQLAADAVDEAMMRAFQRWGRVAGMDDPCGWVYRVAHNWATSWLRKMARRPTRSRERLDRAVMDARGDVDLMRAVLDLSDGHREVVVLRFYLDWPVARIASALDVPAGTVKSRLHRALAMLRDSEGVGTATADVPRPMESPDRRSAEENRHAR